MCLTSCGSLLSTPSIADRGTEAPKGNGGLDAVTADLDCQLDGIYVQCGKELLGCQ